MDTVSQDNQLLFQVSNLIKRFDIDETTPVVLMVSGGSDSAALAYLAADLKEKNVLGNVVMLHVNHKIRGKQADEDALFVEGLAQHLQIPLFSCEVDIPQIVAETGKNLEAAARYERYNAARQALQSSCEHWGCSVDKGVIFTAHTANDRVENFFMRSIVGTGPGGFRSMHDSTYIEGVRVIRPLLSQSREVLRLYLEQRNNTYKGSLNELWREDSTNEDTDYFRAFVRHEIIPQALSRNPKLIETLTRTMNLIADEDDMIASYARSILLKKVTPLGQTPGEGMLVSPELLDEPLPIQRRVIERTLKLIFSAEDRIEYASIEACLNTLGVSGAVRNIQNNYALSYNKQGLRIEPMECFRARRNRL